MTKEEIDIQKEIEKYFTESTGFGKDKIRNFMDIVNKALKQKGERIEELELELTVEKDLHQEETNLHLHAEEYIKSLEKENKTLEGCLLAEQEHTQMLEKQIEKMKCCGNCKFSNQEGVYTIVCKVGGVDKTDYIEIDDNQVCDKWELREIKEND